MKQLFSIFLFIVLFNASYGQTDMIIYQNYGPILVYPLAEIDTITYSEGSLGSAPLVSTLPVLNELPHSAVSGGVISFAGESEIVERGICYGTTPDPGFGDNVVTSSGGDYYLATLTGLEVSNELSYFVRAFAINETDTAFGNEVVFIPNPNPCEGETVVTDLDGNEYEVVEIGEQCWMAENLRTTVFANGDSLVMFTELDESWTPVDGYYWYDFDSSYDEPYGKLYPQITLEDSRNLCPVGWKVPTLEDWHDLFTFINPSFDPEEGYEGFGLGGPLKANDEIWNPPNVGAENSLGFNGIPGGNYHVDLELEEEGFEFLGERGFYGFDDNNEDDYTKWFLLTSESNEVSMSGYLNPNQAWPMSVRCIKD